MTPSPDACTHGVISPAKRAVEAATLSRNLHRDLARMLGDDHYAQCWFLEVARQAEELARLAQAHSEVAARHRRHLRAVP